MTAILADLLPATAVGTGLWLIANGWTNDDRQDGRPASRRPTFFVRQTAVAVAGGTAVWWLTSWPVAGLLGAAAVWALPGLLRPNAQAQGEQARIEGIAAWAEMLRDTLTAAAGLEQAILATAPIAPAALRPHLATLRERVQAGEHLPAALRRLAAEVADPLGDLVVLALVHAAEHQARDLARLLGDLATTAREQAALRLRVAAGRARVVTSVRIIVGVTATMAAGLVILSRHYLTPYSTGTGQLVLAVVGALFAVAYLWLARTARMPAPQRLLALPDAATDPRMEVLS